MIKNIKFVVPEPKVYRLIDQETGKAVQFQSYDMLDNLAEKIQKAGSNPSVTTEISYIDDTKPDEQTKPTSVIKERK